LKAYEYIIEHLEIINEKNVEIKLYCILLLKVFLPSLIEKHAISVKKLIHLFLKFMNSSDLNIKIASIESLSFLSEPCREEILEIMGNKFLLNQILNNIKQTNFRIGIIIASLSLIGNLIIVDKFFLLFFIDNGIIDIILNLLLSNEFIIIKNSCWLISNLFGLYPNLILTINTNFLFQRLFHLCF